MNIDIVAHVAYLPFGEHVGEIEDTGFLYYKIDS